ncbi:MAG: PcfB family protein [Peptostreptococcaceae bacterium]
MPIGGTGEDAINIGAKISHEIVKLSGDLLRKLLDELLKKMEDSPGKKSLQNLLSSGKELKTVEISKGNLKDFNDMCKKYGIQFTAVSEKGSDKKSIIFKAEDLDRMEKVLGGLIDKELSKVKDSTKSINRNINTVQESKETREGNVKAPEKNVKENSR